MVEKVITSGRNVIDFARYQQARLAGVVKAAAISPRCCRHCGAEMAEGESDDDCSSTFNVEARNPSRKFYAD